MDNHQDDTQSAAQNNTKPSNLRSRWKRKAGSATSTDKPQSNQNYGEIDPNSVKETLKQQAKKIEPMVDQKPVQKAPTPAAESITEWTPPEKKATFDKPSREAGHKPHQELPLLDIQKKQPKKFEKNHSKTPDHTPITPATYRPTTLPVDTFWGRIKEFFKALFSSEKAPKKQGKKHANTGYYSRKPKNDQPHWKKSNTDFHYRKKNHRSYEKGSRDR